MIYFIIEKYIPGSAPTNRILSYAKAFSRKKIPTTILFIFPNEKEDKVNDKYSYIKFRYLWTDHFSANRFLKWIIAKIRLQLFIKKLNIGDIIYLYNNSELIDFFTPIEGIKVYHERTEHPNAHDKIYSRFKKISLQEYYQSCCRLDGLFVISSALKNLFIENGVKKEKIHIANITVDTSRFEGVTKRSDSKYIAYCGTASNNKDGVDHLIKSFFIFEKFIKGYKLVIIGKTPSPNDESQNLQLINKLGIEKDVIFTGFVAPDKMPQILKDATILALDRPDNLQAKYGFPTKLGEYLLTKNPVVVTKVGDIPTFFENKKNAILVEPEDDDAFANGLIWLIKNPHEAIIIGEQGAEVAYKSFDCNVVAENIINVLNS